MRLALARASAAPHTDNGQVGERVREAWLADRQRAQTAFADATNYAWYDSGTNWISGCCSRHNASACQAGRRMSTTISPSDARPLEQVTKMAAALNAVTKMAAQLCAVVGVPAQIPERAGGASI